MEKGNIALYRSGRALLMVDCSASHCGTSEAHNGTGISRWATLSSMHLTVGCGVVRCISLEGEIEIEVCAWLGVKSAMRGTVSMLCVKQ